MDEVCRFILKILLSSTINFILILKIITVYFHDDNKINYHQIYLDSNEFFPSKVYFVSNI